MAMSNATNRPCFSGHATFLACCVERQPFPECPAPSSRCCEHFENSRWFKEQLQCWNVGGESTAYGYGVLRRYCCTTFFGACFTSDFTPDRCCVHSKAGSTRRSLDKGLPWTSLGHDYQAVCHGDPRHPKGVVCVPNWLGYDKLLGHLLYCGALANTFAYHFLMMLGFHYAITVRSPPKEVFEDNVKLLSSCFNFYDRHLRSNLRAMKGTVVLISPLLQEFDVLSQGRGLHTLTELMYSDSRARVLGLPTMANETWTWPIFNLRLAYWKLSAMHYPFGYRAWADPEGSEISHCFGGDTTSGTRVYNASTLRSLLRRSSVRGSAWLLGLDLEMKKRNLGIALTCLNGGGSLLHEKSYLQFTALEDSLGDIEAARFHPESPVQLSCGHKTWQDAIAANAAGMVAPYCIRLALHRALGILKGIFEKHRENTGPLLPLFGTALSLLRLGSSRGEVMPWDYEADATLVVNQYIKKKLWLDFEAAGFEVSEGESSAPVVAEHWELTRLDPELNVTATMDLFVQSVQGPPPDWQQFASFELHSLPMQISSQVLFWIRERTPTAPIIRHGVHAHGTEAVESYRCPEHNACMPAGQRNDGFMEAMPDSFAKLDVWD